MTATGHWISGDGRVQPQGRNRQNPGNVDGWSFTLSEIRAKMFRFRCDCGRARVWWHKPYPPPAPACTTCGTKAVHAISKPLL